MYLGILLLCLTGLSWTITGAIYSLIGHKGANSSIIQILASAMLIVLGFALMPFQPSFDFSTPVTWCTIGLLVFGGIVGYLHTLLICRAMGLGPNGISFAVYQAAMIIPFVMGITIHGESANALRLASFTTLLVGILLIGGGGDLRKNYGQNVKKNRKLWLLVLFSSFLANGIYMYIQGLASRNATNLSAFTPATRTTFVNIGIFVAPWIHKLFKQDLFHKPTRFECLAAIISVILSIIGHYFLLLPGLDYLTQANAGAIAFPIIVGTCLVTFTAYSAIKLRERYSLLEWLGLIFSTLGVIGLSF